MTSVGDSWKQALGAAASPVPVAALCALRVPLRALTFPSLPLPVQVF